MSSLIDKLITFIKDVRFFYIIIAIIFVSGIINYAVEGINLSPTLVYARSIRYQSLIETIIYVFVTTLGLGGAFLLLRIKNQRSKRLASLYFVIGISILLLASILPYWIWWLKLY